MFAFLPILFLLHTFLFNMPISLCHSAVLGPLCYYCAAALCLMACLSVQHIWIWQRDTWVFPLSLETGNREDIMGLKWKAFSGWLSKLYWIFSLLQLTSDGVCRHHVVAGINEVILSWAESCYCFLYLVHCWWAGMLWDECRELLLSKDGKYTVSHWSCSLWLTWKIAT